jgi:hypothetical protein
VRDAAGKSIHLLPRPFDRYGQAGRESDVFYGELEDGPDIPGVEAAVDVVENADPDRMHLIACHALHLSPSTHLVY